jgi:uncharacterized membrane protein YdjX (TVP38/TMEM64 family)
LALVAVGLFTAIALGLPHELSLRQLHHHRQELAALAHVHPILTVAGYVAVYAVAIGLSLPVAMVLTVTGGLLFGTWIGGFSASVGATLGATLVFVACRTAAGDLLRRRAGPTIARIEDGVLADAFSYVMMLRLLPVMSMTLANLALGFIEIPLRTFVLATFAGILPVSLIYASLGASLGKLFAQGAHPHLHELVRPGTLAALAGLAVLSLAPIAVRRWRRRT